MINLHCPTSGLLSIPKSYVVLSGLGPFSFLQDTKSLLPSTGYHTALAVLVPEGEMLLPGDMTMVLFINRQRMDTALDGIIGVG